MIHEIVFHGNGGYDYNTVYNIRSNNNKYEEECTKLKTARSKNLIYDPHANPS